MARIRSIHPNACTSEKLAAIGAEAERCYWRLQTHCDDGGRCEDHPRLIWAALFPLHEDITPAKVDKWLGELHGVGLIVRYDVDARRYLQVTQWGVFQHPNHPSPSKLPEPYSSPPVAVTEPSAPTTPLVGEGVGGGEGVGDARTAFADDFSRWWSYYPRKIDRGAALKAYQARRRSGTTEAALLAAVMCYATATAGTERQFIKHGATFLHGSWSEWEHGPPADRAGPARVPANSIHLPRILAEMEGNGHHGATSDDGVDPAHAGDLAEIRAGRSSAAALGAGPPPA